MSSRYDSEGQNIFAGYFKPFSLLPGAGIQISWGVAVQVMSMALNEMKLTKLRLS